MAISAKQWRDAGNKTNRSPESLARQRSARLSRYHDDQAVRDKAIADARKRRLAKPDVVKAENAAWRAAHGPELRAYHAEYQRNRRATDPVFHRRCLDQQTMWRVRNWAKDSESEAWIRRVEDQDIDPTWRRRMHGWHAGRCYVCNNPCDDLTIEHVVPRSRGGPTVRQNIVLSCPSCNYSRQDRMWGAEWMPRIRHDDHDGFALRRQSIANDLANAGLDGGQLPDGSYLLCGPDCPPRSLLVMSTFACSDRNPGSGGGHVLDRLRETNPGAILILDHEWHGRRRAVLNMLRAKMKIATRQAGARKLQVVEATSAIAAAFLHENHVMGAVDAPFRIGLSNGDALLGVGLFADRGDRYECVRLAFDGHVAGGMSRIMEGLRRTHGAKPISSYVDTRYAVGDGHETIGFVTTGQTDGTYVWVLPDRVQHQRYLSNDNKMSRNLLYFDPALPREQNIRANGVFKTWLPPRLQDDAGVALMCRSTGIRAPCDAGPRPCRRSR